MPLPQVGVRTKLVYFAWHRLHPKSSQKKLGRWSKITAQFYSI